MFWKLLMTKKASTRSLAPNLNSLYLFCLDRITVMARLLRRRVTYLRKLLSWLLPYKMMSCVCLSGRVDAGHVWSSNFEQLLSRKDEISILILRILCFFFTHSFQNTENTTNEFFLNNYYYTFPIASCVGLNLHNVSAGKISSFSSENYSHAF